MSKIYLSLFMVLFSCFVCAQELSLNPTQDTNANYRIFNTMNVYTLLKLDTRSGKVWQVQWGTPESRFIVPINTNPLSASLQPGRFTLVPTQNIYTFLLLDQITGDVWHLQWGDVNDRFIAKIEDLSE